MTTPLTGARAGGVPAARAWDSVAASAAGIPPPPDFTPLPPAVGYPDPPGYRLTAPLGSGGMGVVFAADQVALGRTVAIKFLRADASSDPDLLARFQSEAAALARAPHPNIVQVFEVGEVGGRPFLVLELVPGGTLADKLAAGPLAPRAAAGLARTLAVAVAAAHAAGIVHRDLKPANVLLAPDGTPKVTDFGLAKPVDAAGDSGTTRTGMVLGTPGYMAPEQARGDRHLGPAADVYALGAVLYECLTGRVPFRAATVLETLNLVCAADPPLPRQLQPGVPQDLETICLKCLRKAPAQRYPTAQTLADDLDRFLAGQAIAARPVGPVERLAKWVRRNPAGATAAGVTAAALLVGAVGVATHNARLRAALEAKTAEEEKARREKDRADANYRDARAAVRQMLDRVEDRKYAAVPRLRELHQAQAAAALAYFRAVADQRDDLSPEVRADAARADFEAGRTVNLLGDPKTAADHFRHALDGFDRLHTDAPADRGVRHDRANTRTALANLTPDAADAGRLFDQSVADLTALAAEPPATFDERSTLANVLNSRAARRLHDGRRDEAEADFRAALALRDELTAARPDDRWSARHRADVLTNLSSLCQQTARPELSAEFHDRAAAALQVLADADPDDRGTIITLASLRVNWTYNLIDRKQFADALVRLDRTLPPLERLHRLEPNDAGVRDGLFRVHGVRAQVAAAAGRLADVVVDQEKAVAYAVPSQRRFHGWFLARSRMEAGDLVGAVNDLDRLERELDRPADIGEPYHGAETAAQVAARLRAAAAVAGAGPAAALDRAEGVAVRLLGKVRAAAGLLGWLQLVPRLAAEPLFQPLLRRDDYQRAVGGLLR